MTMQFPWPTRGALAASGGMSDAGLGLHGPFTPRTPRCDPGLVWG
jgi:hypothetical protein